MMLSRRFRALLLFATLSAMGWMIMGGLISVGFEVLYGGRVGPDGLAETVSYFAFFGFVAGVIWAVTLPALPRKSDHTVPALTASLAGALGGVLVAIGMIVGTGSESASWVAFNLAYAAGIGGVVGLSFQRVAARGKLPAPDPSPEAIEAATAGRSMGNA